MTHQERQDVTMLLQGVVDDPKRSDELFPLIYDELRRLAASQMAVETPGQTLQPTALVHEAYIRLVGDADNCWDNRGHFFAAAARSMRQILINRALRKKRRKHGGDRQREEYNDALIAEEPPPERMIALDEALERLEVIDEQKGRIVMLRYFAGLTIQETAKSLNLSSATVKREWRFAKAWLQREMSK